MTKDDHADYLETLVDLIDNGYLNCMEASMQYWADFQMDKITDEKWLRRDV